MAVVLAIGGSPVLTDHEAHALAALLAADGAAALAARLDPRVGCSGAVELAPDEKRALLLALGELRDEHLPPHLVAIERTLAEELDAFPST